MDKAEQRRKGYAARAAQGDKEGASAQICRRFLEQSWQQSARTVMWYVGCRAEVQTLPTLASILSGAQRIVVPYCTRDQHGERCLGLWRLRSINELELGTWNILEPPKSRWNDTERQVAVAELDVVMVPGVAFDRQGGRLGNGAGYYDRLLLDLRVDAIRAGVCYDSQLLASVSMEAHDVYMDYVITETNLYRCPTERGR